MNSKNPILRKNLTTVMPLTDHFLTSPTPHADKLNSNDLDDVSITQDSGESDSDSD